jgi:3'-phosphoadenosine 5'-phosphosulfate synthase
VIEIGDGPLPMGTITPVKVIGSLELIDEGETDHKIIALRSSDPHIHSINSLHDLEKYHPNVTKKLIDWLKNYKTSDGKLANKLAREVPNTAEEAMSIINEVSEFYEKLISGESDHSEDYELPFVKK